MLSMLARPAEESKNAARRRELGACRLGKSRSLLLPILTRQMGASGGVQPPVRPRPHVSAVS